MMSALMYDLQEFAGVMYVSISSFRRNFPRCHRRCVYDADISHESVKRYTTGATAE